MSDRPIKINRNRKEKKILPVVLFFFAALLLSLAVAALWQSAAGDTDLFPKRHPAPTVSFVESNVSQPEQSSPQESSSEPVSLPEPAEPPMLAGVVPESERVKSSYFEDAVFVGDSITTGIQLYNVMESATVLAGTGINLDTIYSSPVVKQEDGTRITIMDGLKQAQYGKIYMMLGGNEVRDVEQDAFIARYSKVIDDVRALQPNAIFYVQSILPVTEQNNYNMDNDRIDTFNAALIALCQDKQVYYLNVAECMKDENGRLPNAASPADGMHFGPDYYNKWFEYLKTHTIGSNTGNSEKGDETT